MSSAIKNESLTQRRLTGLANLLTVEREARHAPDLEKLGFVIVNESLRLFSYQQAVFWLWSPNNKIKLQSISGVASFDVNSPQVLWFLRAIDSLINITPAETIVQKIGPHLLTESMQKEWLQWSQSAGLSLSLQHPLTKQPLGGVWLMRESPWEEGEMVLAERLAEGFAQSLALLQSSRRNGFFRGLSGWLLRPLVILFVMVAIFSLPVPQSVLAPAEIVAIEPEVVAAPMDGVVAKFYVEPNQAVTAGQRLFDLDPEKITNRRQVALDELALAQAEYRKAAQQAFAGDHTGAGTAALKAMLDKAAAEVAYSEKLLQRLQVTAAGAGVAVFANTNDWLGRPVHLGERVLSIANPERVEVDIFLALDDAIILQPGAKVRLFLNTDPVSPLEATLRYASYEASETSPGILAYSLKASFLDAGKKPRLGLKGVAKLYGDDTTLFIYLFRRPLTALRQQGGW